MWNINLHYKNGSVFVHGGIHPKYSTNGVNGINKVSHSALNQDKIPYEPMITAEDCPVWYRGFVLNDEKIACPLLAKSLKLLKVRRC